MEKQPVMPENMPGSQACGLNDLKTLVQQLERFLPEDKRNVIQNTIAQMESGRIQSEAQAQELLNGLMQTLGIGMMPK